MASPKCRLSTVAVVALVRTTGLPPKVVASNSIVAVGLSLNVMLIRSASPASGVANVQFDTIPEKRMGLPMGVQSLTHAFVTRTQGVSAVRKRNTGGAADP